MAAAADTAPEPDRLDGAPHPRETPRLFGQEAAERAFLDAWTGGRLHHAWLLRGPRGVGKATLAYRIARAVLAADGRAPATLDVDAENPVARRIRAGAEPRLFTLRRPLDPKSGKLRTVITAETARGMQGRLFDLTAADGGWRVGLVDTADELQLPQAANALLKLVEEPPPRALLLLVCNQPGRLLPTIRSRCRVLDLAPLAPEALAQAVAQAGRPDVDEALATLAGGSPGEALRLATLDAPAVFGSLCALLDGAPGLSRAKLVALARSSSGRDAAGRFGLVLSLTTLLLRRLARAGAGHPLPPLPGEARLAARLAPGLAAARAWAELAAEIAAQGAHAEAVNLDPAGTILDIWLRIDGQAARLAAAS